MHPLCHFLTRWKCKSIFDQLALGALRGIEGDAAARWQSLFLWRIESFLRGVDAPAAEFRDYTNHSFDPHEPWGTAPRLAAKWYDKTVASLNAGRWREGTHDAGVLLRYAACSLLMLHGHHRDPGLSRRSLFAWTVARNYQSLMAIAREQPPSRLNEWDSGDVEGFLAQAALKARADEEIVLDRMTPELFKSDPPRLDDELRLRLARHLADVEQSLGEILRQTLAQVETSPRHYPVGFAHGAAWPSLPVFWATRTHARLDARRTIQAMRSEWESTGRIRETQPDDARALHDAYAIAHGANPRDERRGMTPPLHLAEGIPFSIERGNRPEAVSVDPITWASSVREATSIRPELAERLDQLGVGTVRQLLAANPEELAAKLSPHATSADVLEWRDEAALCQEIPLLLPVEAQLLVACGVTGRNDLAALAPVELWELVIPVAESPDGARILGEAPIPNLDAVTEWIQAARLKVA